MSTLLLRLSGPMQSWGTQSRFGNRDTGLEPSKSGVLGLLCCALGWQREADTFPFETGSQSLEAFCRSLTMAVRADREGRMSRDYQTAQDVIRSDRSGRAETVLSDRFYLADAEFVVGLSHDDDALLAELDQALRSPVWPLCLGRRSFPPSLPVPIGVSEGELLPALAREPLFNRGDRRRGVPPERLRVVCDAPAGEGSEVRQDVPLCFGYQRRRFATRFVQTLFLPDESRGLPMPPVGEEVA